MKKMYSVDKRKLISRMVPEGSFFGRLFLFQSVRQFVSYLVTLVIIVAILFFLSMTFSDGKVDPDIIFAAVLGTLSIVYMVLPCSFVLSATPDRALMGMMDDRLDKMGYVLKDRDGGQPYTYKSKLPRVLSWDENRVVIRTFPSEVVVSGSRIAVKSLRAWLLRQVDMF